MPLLDHDRTRRKPIGHILQENFTVRDVGRVVAFLRSHFLLTYFLAGTLTNIRRYFPTSEIFFLEVVADPGSGDEQLVLSVLADDPIEAEESMRRFDDGWWLDHMTDTDGALCITLEFRDGPAKRAAIEEAFAVAVPRETPLAGQCQAGHDRGFEHG